MRLFFAIELPPELQAALGRLPPTDESRAYRWVEPALLHVTLVFLGEQPAERIETLRQVGTDTVAHARRGWLRLGQPDSFGTRGAPRVLFVSLAGDVEALHALQARLNHDLREAGFRLEDRPFRPHITLARRRVAARAGSPPGWPPTASPTPRDFEMRDLTLFESRLSPRGASYLPVCQLPISS